MARLFATALYFLFSGVLSHAAAAEFRVLRGDDPGFVIVLAAGKLEYGDDERFLGTIAGISSAVVLLDGPGGNLLAGIGIGKAIRLRGLDTLVGPNGSCFSACALAWLGGRNRFLDRSGALGFHAASVRADGIDLTSGSGNALVGAYLTNLGLGEDAVFALTQAGPGDMLILTPAVAQRLRIELAMVALDEDASAADEADGEDLESSTPAPVPGDWSARSSAAQGFVMRHFVVASQMAPGGVASLAKSYAEQVNYFGKPISRAAVLADAERYAARWPVRTTTLSMYPQVSCGARGCVVTGEASFDARSRPRNVHSSGTFRYRFDLVPAGDGFRITAQSSEVLTRSVRPLDTSARLVWQLQSALARAGCDPGPVDGIWGGVSERAMQRFNSATGQRLASAYPTPDALAAVGRRGASCRTPMR